MFLLCFCCFFVCECVFCCFCLPRNEQETPPALCKSALCPMVPINFYWPGSYCFSQTLAPYPDSVQACRAIPYPPAECLDVPQTQSQAPRYFSSVGEEMHPEVPVWPLWAIWEFLWDKHGYFQSDSHICSGEPYFMQRVSLGVSVTSFHQNVYFLSIIGISHSDQ